MSELEKSLEKFNHDLEVSIKQEFFLYLLKCRQTLIHLDNEREFNFWLDNFRKIMELKSR